MSRRHAQTKQDNTKIKYRMRDTITQLTYTGVIVDLASPVYGIPE